MSPRWPSLPRIGRSQTTRGTRGDFGACLAQTVPPAIRTDRLPQNDTHSITGICEERMASALGVVGRGRGVVHHVIGAGGVFTRARRRTDDSTGQVSPVVGGFGLGDDVEGLVDERAGTLSLDLSASGAGLRWTSGTAAGDRFGFGAGLAPDRHRVRGRSPTTEATVRHRSSDQNGTTRGG